MTNARIRVSFSMLPYAGLQAILPNQPGSLACVSRELLSEFEEQLTGVKVSDCSKTFPSWWELISSGDNCLFSCST